MQVPMVVTSGWRESSSRWQRVATTPVKRFCGVIKPCMVEMVSFLNCLALNKHRDDKCIRQKELLVACTQAQQGKPKNAANTINYHLQMLGRDKFH
ncbi:uncharacterized protein LOC124695294 [Lolium rigidum]|uniref:uncharacterized protein LOC124695294 n=1 Tax=Lolium rigidum TaxID=89674 RepID=UPI001F5CBCC4|nr:uncharacterized protein LOC124695294 [Lolium rigidum]